jgi:hypothetical protein
VAEGEMGEHRPGKRGAARSIGEFQRELVRRWRRALLRRGFTEGQAAYLIMVKLLYIRGSLRG